MEYVEIPGNVRLGITYDAVGGYAMTLFEGEREIATGVGFRPRAGRDLGAGDAELHTVETFAGFLRHALESEDEDARDGWTIHDEEAAARILNDLYAYAQVLWDVEIYVGFMRTAAQERAAELAPDARVVILDGSQWSPAWRLIPRLRDLDPAVYEVVDEAFDELEAEEFPGGATLHWEDGVLFLEGPEFRASMPSVA